MTDPITHLNAALEGHYRVERQLGEGGMATVYLADDLRHERKVALKVLKPELAAVVGAERFLAEIKTTANLQHPHILPLFYSGEADGFLFYVMPFVEGESLRARLDREHQLPVDEAVQIAMNVAEALDYAHRRGVVHRDIKPANILLQDGNPVVSDFGIALALGVAGGGRLTETGVSLGTPRYMSPEQATGDQNVGPPTDSYALGCVLYEMLVGEPPYTGSTAQAVLGKIITATPDPVREQRASVPPNVDAAIRRALEKVPADRFTATRDFGRALSDPAFRHGETAAATGASRGPLIWLSVLAGALAVASAAALGFSLRPADPSAATARFSLQLPEELTFGGGTPQNLAVSPDGSSIVFSGVSLDGDVRLWVQPFDELSPRPIPGTEGSGNPRFSPDGQSVAFWNFGRLQRVSISGGAPRTLVSEAVDVFGLAWGSDGMLYFVMDDGIWRVPEEGGEAEQVTEGAAYTWPDALPGGKGLLFTRGSGSPETSEIAVVSLETGEVRTLVPGTVARYAQSGHIVYASRDGDLFAVPFDVDRMEITGPERLLLQGVELRRSVDFALSGSGSFVYLPAPEADSGQTSRSVELIWVTRTGVPTPVDPDWQFVPGAGIALSPDGARVAVSAEVEGNVDIWIKGVPDGAFERLTSDVEDEIHPAWSRDGQFVTYVRMGEQPALWRRRADATGRPELLFAGEPLLYQESWHPDGEWLVGRTSGAVSLGGAASRDIVGLRPGVDSAVVPLVVNPEGREQDPALSPDGHWLAYSSASSETGQLDVYVNSFPRVDSVSLKVSTNIGRSPLWANGGTELFFLDYRENVVVAAELETDPQLRVLRRTVLFTPAGLGLTFPATSTAWAITPDDQRFLMIRSADRAAGGGRYILIQNFFEELREQVPN